MKKYLLISSIFMLLIACQKKEKEQKALKGLQLTLLNKNVEVFCPDKDCSKASESFPLKDYLKNSITTIKFKIENPDEQPYIFIPFCFNSWDAGCPPINSFPDNFASLDINNLIFTDSINKKVEIKGFLGKIEDKDLEKYEDITDSLKKTYYNSLSYDDKLFKWKVNNENITKRMIIIHPNEVLFFEVPVNLPINYNALGGIINQVNLSKEERYKMKLIFKSKIEDVERYLTTPQLQTFRANNYRFFDKELISSNSIDVKFVD